MLRLPKVRVVAPRSLAEASRLLAEGGAGARLFSGGTDVVPKLKRRQLSARTLVDLGAVPGYGGIRRRGGRLVIGAGTRIAELAELSEPGLAALREAAASVATPQIRAQATLGGNLALETRCTFYDQSDSWRQAQGFCLKTHADAPCRAAPGSTRCWSVSSGDLPPALIALGARVRVVGEGGEREAALEDLYQDDGCAPLRLATGELIASVSLEPAARRSTYRKLRRRGSFDFASLGVAVAVTSTGGVVADCRVVLGGLGSGPLVAEEAAACLRGCEPTARRIDDAAEAARRVRPVENGEF
ncbi:MAG: FAD binding domain-containing protein, partial [Elusimicrobia bacterium]|nr:FAD binding domain-containing protein [Elusimicrobiota bacterium]